jgi:hypothetical protein
MLEDEPESTRTIYEVMYQGQPIGRSRLEWHDAPMGIALGIFYSLPAYDAVQPVFQLFQEAVEAQMRGDAALAEEQSARYYQVRDALGLILQTAEGRRIPTSVIHIVEGGDLGRELEVGITDSGFWLEHQFN